MVMPTSQHKGYSVLHILLALIVLSLVITSGYLVYSKDRENTTDIVDVPAITETQETPENTTESTNKTQEYLSEENVNFKFSYPAKWQTGDQTEIKCLFSPEASITPSPTSCEVQKPDGFASISIRYSSVGYAIESISDVAVYNGVSFTKNSTTNNGYTVYEFDIKPEIQNANVTGKLVRVAYPDNPNAWVELDYKYVNFSVDYSPVFEEILNSLELLSSTSTRGVGG